MAKPQLRSTPAYRCAECGWSATKWVGRCAECQAWGSVEASVTPVGMTRAGPVGTVAVPIREVDATSALVRPTGVAELDRVLGGGLVPGGVVLLAGEPGVGKSTLLLQAASRWALGEGRSLYVSGEESAAQVRLRAERTGALADALYLAAETDLAAVLGHLEAVQPSLLVLDSVQAVASGEVDGSAGGVAQVREVAAALTRVAKHRGVAVVLVGHVTKDGSIAGPRTLEHLVDVVLHFEGDRHSRLRLVRSVKNRFGPADEVGCFDLSEAGIVSLADPTGLFVSRHEEPVPGSCLTVTVEGRRPLLAEVQALVTPSATPTPRRATSGLDPARVAMVLAVLERRGGVRLSSCEVYSASVGGMRLTEPATDLAVALAVASSQLDLPMPAGMAAVGEVGLAGEVRSVPGVQRRIAEAARLGARCVLVPPGAADAPAGSAPRVRVKEVADIRSALRLLTLR